MFLLENRFDTHVLVGFQFQDLRTFLDIALEHNDVCSFVWKTCFACIYPAGVNAVSQVGKNCKSVAKDLCTNCSVLNLSKNINCASQAKISAP